jgi:hypothetical protein
MILTLDEIEVTCMGSPCAFNSGRYSDPKILASCLQWRSPWNQAKGLERSSWVGPCQHAIYRAVGGLVGTQGLKRVVQERPWRRL